MTNAVFFSRSWHAYRTDTDDDSCSPAIANFHKSQRPSKQKKVNNFADFFGKCDLLRRNKKSY